MLIDAQPAVLKWMQQVALEGEAYKNEVVDILGEENGALMTEELGASWGSLEMDAVEESEAAAQKPDIKHEGTVDSKGVEVQAQTENGNAKDDKAQATGTTKGAQKTEKGSDGEPKNDGKPVKGKLDPLSFARDIPGSVGEGDSPPPKDSPEGCDMVDLVKETEDLRLHQ